MPKPLPKWEMWKHVPTLTAEQAVALTLGVDPHKVHQWGGGEDIWVYDNPGSGSCSTVEGFTDRLFLFEKCFGVYGGISPSQLTVWAKSVNWNMPNELEELATDAPAPKVEAAPIDLKGLAAFRAMENLTADKLSIAFVGEKPGNNSDIGADTMLKISANNVTTCVSLAELDLWNRVKKGLNGEGKVLLTFVLLPKLNRNETNGTVISRLRKIFKKHLGITNDPFYPKSAGWSPRFTIVDKRGDADERLKREAIDHKTDSYEQSNERGEKASNANQTQQSSEDEYPFGGAGDKDAGDEADKFLRGNA